MKGLKTILIVIKEYANYKCTILERLHSLTIEWKVVGTKTDTVVYYPKRHDDYITKSIDITYYIKQNSEGSIIARKIKVVTTREVIKKYLNESMLVKESIKWVDNI